MARRRRGRYNPYSRYGSEQSPEKILLAEFKFYNKDKKVIDLQLLKEIEERLPEEKKIYWTNKNFADNGIGFVFTMESRNRKPVPYIQIVDTEMKFKAEDFCRCKLIADEILFITFQLAVLEMELLEDFRFNKSEIDKVPVVNNWEELSNYLLTSKKITNYEGRNQDEWEEFEKDAKVLLKGLELPQPKYRITKRGYCHNSVYHIIKVIEKRINDINYRLALVTEVSYYHPTYKFKVFKEDDPDYNYVDDGRIFFTSGGASYFMDVITNEYNGSGELIVLLDVFNAMESNVKDILGVEQRVVTPSIYRFYKDRDSSNEFTDDSHRSIKEMAILNKYKELLTDGKKVKIDDVIVEPGHIKVVGEAFSIKFGKDFLDTAKEIGKIKDCLKQGDARYNFNHLYEGLLKIGSLRICHYDHVRNNSYKNFKPVNFLVNNIGVKVEKINNRWRINGVFCRINDVYYILSKVICYKDAEEFNTYVKDVSHIGVEWMRMICNGVTLQLTNPFHKIFQRTGQSSLEKMYLRFSMLWDIEKRSSVYLLLNGVKYLIKYKGKFKQHFNYPNRVLSMEQLNNELNESIQNLNTDDIVGIVENALAEAKIIQERGEQLVKETIRDIHAEESEIEVRGGALKGYKFKGRLSGTWYFVDKLKLEVFKMDGGAWNRRCVVDDHRKQRIFEDRLANRLANIYNEPKKIFTLHN